MEKPIAASLYDVDSIHVNLSRQKEKKEKGMPTDVKHSLLLYAMFFLRIHFFRFHGSVSRRQNAAMRMTMIPNRS
jgi:hypothetical protein